MTPQRAPSAAIVAAVVAALCLSPAREARADEPGADVAVAAELFRKAKELMAANEHARACPLLEQSQRLDPGTGTLLNLAVCHETIGRTATAWAEYSQVIPLAKAATPPRLDRARLAQARADALAPALSHVTVHVPTAARTPGLVVQLDGARLDAVAWETKLPVDPGAHMLTARAEGKLAWTLDVHIGAEGGDTEIAIPPLEDATRPPPAEPRVSVRAPVRDADAVAAARTRRVVGLVTGSVGVAAVGAGVTFGVAAMSAARESDRLCPSTPCASLDGVQRSRDANALASVTNVVIGAGLVAIGVGAVLVLTSRGPSGPASARALRAVPIVGLGHAGAALGGEF